MSNFRNTEEMKKQYETSSNLNSRILLHQLFSTNKLGWSNWVFQNYELKPGQSILELGCGDANIWKINKDKIPNGIKITLSDFSPGMLNTAKENTNNINGIEYQIIDAQDIPFADNMFDIVIANHMLYHVPDINKALCEISRVNKKDGVFYSTTMGSENLKELINLLHDFDCRIDFAQSAITDAFGLESGCTILEKHFHSVELKKYVDSLHITEPTPLIDYVLSSQGIGNVNDIITDERVAEFSKYITALFEDKGYIDIYKDAGMFISYNSAT